VYVTLGSGCGAVVRITQQGDHTVVAGSEHADWGRPGHIDGVGSLATFFFPRAVAVDKFGSVFVADYENNAVRLISMTGNMLLARVTEEQMIPLPKPLISLVIDYVQSCGVVSTLAGP
jgi:hypothetical protein